MTLADRFIRYGAIPGNEVDRPIIHHIQRELVSGAVPVILCSNVAQYVSLANISLSVKEIEDWPGIAPAWSAAWFEYDWPGAGGGRVSAYVHASDLRDKNAKITNLGLEQIAQCQRNHPMRTPRWMITSVLFGVERGHTIHGPVFHSGVVLDEHGKVLGAPDYDVNGAPQELHYRWLTPVFQTIAFTHCKNVTLESHTREPKLAQAYRKRHKQEPVRWQTIRLIVPQRKGDAPPGDGTSSRELASGLHIVMGHFAHYGDCCPGQHPERGKLFGKLDGIYWMPMHLRGDKNGEIRSDYNVVVDETDEGL